MTAGMSVGLLLCMDPMEPSKNRGGPHRLQLEKGQEPPLEPGIALRIGRGMFALAGPIAARLLFSSKRHHIWRATKLALGWSNSGKILVSSSTENLSDYQGYTCISSWHAVVTIDT